MNFFKSVFSEDPTTELESESPKQQQQQPDPTESPNSTTTSSWSFGGLMKTIATRSESVIDTYSRDLKEFGSGLKKEIQVAQGSLSNVTHVIDEFGNTVIKGTNQIISQGKDAILAIDHESDSSDTSNSSRNDKGYDSNLQMRYSRFDSQLRVIQSDVSTYCEDPYDLDDYREWKSGFVLDDMKEEIERLVAENGDVGGMFKRFVPGSVDYESFWCRYFYKVYKFKQAEAMRARLVKRAISREEEELSWDVDDSDSDDEEGEREGGVGSKADGGESSKLGGGDGGKKVGGIEDSKSRDAEDGGKEVIGKSSLVGQSNDDIETNVPVKTDVVQNEEIDKKRSEGVGEEQDSVGKSHVEKAELVHGETEKSSDSVNTGKDSVFGSSSGRVPETKVLERGDSGLEKKELDSEFDKKTHMQGNADNEEPHKDSNVSVVSSQPLQPQEEDLGWDEIEDLSSIDDKKATEISSPKRAELRKRLSAAEEDEDLSWDIEDDD